LQDFIFSLTFLPFLAKSFLGFFKLPLKMHFCEIIVKTRSEKNSIQKFARDRNFVDIADF